MTTYPLSLILGKYAIDIGNSLLASVSIVTATPQGASRDSIRVSEGFSAVVGSAQSAQDELIVNIGAVDTLDAQHEQMVAAALDEERILDSTFAAIRDRLMPDVKEGTAGAQLLLNMLFPGGSSLVTGPTGRPQLAVYVSWLQVATSEAATSNLAYALIADKVGAFEARVDAFDATLQEKSRLAAALKAARAARDSSQATWTATFSELIADAARIQGEDSQTFQSWIRPLLDWKANQAAARTRRAGEQAEPAPADVVTDGEGDG